MNLPSVVKPNNGLSKAINKPSSVQTLDLGKSVALKKTSKGENISSQFGIKKGSLDLVLIGDLTGSMASYHRLLKDQFTTLSRELQQFIPDLQIGIVFYLDHGQGDPYTTQACQITPDVKKLHEFIQKTPTGSGGDAPEAVEDALHDVLVINWRPRVNRSIVIFGDATGKEPNNCPHQYSYFGITKSLYEKQVTINSVFCQSGYSVDSLQRAFPVEIGDFSKKIANPSDVQFFSWLANVTGGMIIGVDQITDLLDIIKASAAKDAGVMDEYEASMKKDRTSGRTIELISVSKAALERKRIASKRLMLT
ncbi:MAG: hypothetical protein KDK90_13950 [Leptospiraceae bacterium]|nr:hypothetical protein [Leptospiraceae bacterium]